MINSASKLSHPILWLPKFNLTLTSHQILSFRSIFWSLTLQSGILKKLSLNKHITHKVRISTLHKNITYYHIHISQLIFMEPTPVIKQIDYKMLVIEKKHGRLIHESMMAKTNL